MTKREAQQRQLMVTALMNTGMSFDDVNKLRRISMTLHSWYELECGSDRGAIERNETTGKPYWYNPISDRRFPVADRERGAEKRLAKIMAQYPHLTAYLQTDPRGAALYVLRPQDILPDHDVASYYNRGICVY